VSDRPILAVTAGDPAGVGPEIAVRALAQPDVRRALRALVIGDGAVLEAAVAGCGLPLRLHPSRGPGDLDDDPSALDVLDVGALRAPPRHGVVDAASGRAAMAAIERAVELAREGTVDALVTGPINKEAIRAAGSPHPGHTEMLAALFGVDPRRVVTMFTVGRLRIFFLTRHHPLVEAIAMLTAELVQAGIVRAHELLRELGMERPRLAVAAVNPHAGEHGLIGTEDDEIVAPAVERARAEGVEVRGPVPADSAFWQCRTGAHDAVLALYHDQGHIAAKTVDFFGTVSCTLGLPVVRTAAEHGTAFDIAGRWIANPAGQVNALLAAAELAALRSARLAASGPGRSGS
jgi:4-phospho-D-threonate 3-dehydrogenase / 4-phospho-D-erythronate 3-dehydrogenase